MKKIISLMTIFFSLALFIPTSSAKFKDCWGNWQAGYPDSGDCYSISSVAPDDKPQNSPHNPPAPVSTPPSIVRPAPQPPVYRPIESAASVGNKYCDFYGCNRARPTGTQYCNVYGCNATSRFQSGGFCGIYTPCPNKLQHEPIFHGFHKF